MKGAITDEYIAKYQNKLEPYMTQTSIGERIRCNTVCTSASLPPTRADIYGERRGRVSLRTDCRRGEGESCQSVAERLLPLAYGTSTT